MEGPAFFGEILPVYSRAVDDDEDDSATEIEQYNLAWLQTVSEEIKKSDDQCLRCGVMIISIGVEATAFADIFLIGEQQTEVVGHLSVNTSEHSERKTSTKSACIKRLSNKPDVMFVQTEENIDEAQTHSWTDQLVSHIDVSAASVFVLSTQLATLYSTENINDDRPVPFLRSLTTSCSKEKPKADYVEQPNIVSGLPAQIMTHLEVKNLSGVLYVTYKDVRYVDIDTVKSFTPILTHSQISSFVMSNPRKEKQLLNLAERHKDKSTVYI